MANNVYEMITEKVIKLMEEGKTPWKMPWGNAGGYISRSTGKPYTMLNTMLLMMQGGGATEYLTPKQIFAQGGKIKKGAKAKMVVFFQMVTAKPKTNDPNEILDTYPVLKRYNVFALDDCEGVEPKYCIGDTAYTHDPIAEAERVADGYAQRTGLKVCRDKASDRAYFSPVRDEVVVPCISQYREVSEYYSTLYHELTHSTGIKSRCDRGLGEKIASFGSDDYSREELVAEFGSAFSLGRLGIDIAETTRNSASYLRSWIKTLRNDPRAIVYATSRAEKAVDYIFNEN